MHNSAAAGSVLLAPCKGKGGCSVKKSKLICPLCIGNLCLRLLESLTRFGEPILVDDYVPCALIRNDLHLSMVLCFYPSELDKFTEAFR